MNEFEKAIEYFYRKMENGLIENDEQQEIYELAIYALGEINKLQNGVEK